MGDDYNPNIAPKILTCLNKVGKTITRIGWLSAIMYGLKITDQLTVSSFFGKHIYWGYLAATVSKGKITIRYF